MGNPTGFTRSPLQPQPYSPMGAPGISPQGMSGSGGLNLGVPNLQASPTRMQIQPFTPTNPAVTGPPMPQYSQPGSFNTGTQRMGLALGRFGRE